MSSYRHILVLIRNADDGRILLEQATDLAQSSQARVTVGHVAMDYQALNFISDSQMNDTQSRQIIDIKGWLSGLIKNVTWPVATTLIISMDRMKALNQFMEANAVDLLLVGHQNRLFGSAFAESMRYVNSTHCDVLVIHIDDEPSKP